MFVDRQAELAFLDNLLPRDKSTQAAHGAAGGGS